MVRLKYGTRGNGPLRDTWNTFCEALDGWLLALATLSKGLWQWRVVATGLQQELNVLPGGPPERPRLWRQHSVAKEVTAIGILYVTGILGGVNWLLLTLLGLVVLAGFLSVTEPVNSIIENLADWYQLKLEKKLKPDLFVKLLKHVGAVPTLALNIFSAVAWIGLMIWSRS